MFWNSSKNHHQYSYTYNINHHVLKWNFAIDWWKQKQSSVLLIVAYNQVLIVWKFSKMYRLGLSSLILEWVYSPPADPRHVYHHLRKPYASQRRMQNCSIVAVKLGEGKTWPLGWFDDFEISIKYNLISSRKLRVG